MVVFVVCGLSVVVIVFMPVVCLLMWCASVVWAGGVGWMLFVCSRGFCVVGCGCLVVLLCLLLLFVGCVFVVDDVVVCRVCLRV